MERRTDVKSGRVLIDRQQLAGRLSAPSLFCCHGSTSVDEAESSGGGAKDPLPAAALGPAVCEAQEVEALALWLALAQARSDEAHEPRPGRVQGQPVLAASLRQDRHQPLRVVPPPLERQDARMSANTGSIPATLVRT
jgi:hypothetical protein